MCVVSLTFYSASPTLYFPPPNYNLEFKKKEAFKLFWVCWKQRNTVTSRDLNWLWQTGSHFFSLVYYIADYEIFICSRSLGIHWQAETSFLISVVEHEMPIEAEKTPIDLATVICHHFLLMKQMLMNLNVYPWSGKVLLNTHERWLFLRKRMLFYILNYFLNKLDLKEILS